MQSDTYIERGKLRVFPMPDDVFRMQLQQRPAEGLASVGPDLGAQVETFVGRIKLLP